MMGVFICSYKYPDTATITANDKGTQTIPLDPTPRVTVGPNFPKKKTHTVPHNIMLVSIVISLAQKQKLSGEVESALLYYVS